MSALVHAAPTRFDQVSPVLFEAGLLEESSALCVPDALEYGHGLVSGGAVLTVFDSDYPFRWYEALGVSAPPVVYKRGAPLSAVSDAGEHELEGADLGAVASVVSGLGVFAGGLVFGAGPSLIGVAGSRTPSIKAIAFGKELRQMAAGSGQRLIAGGAEGFDAACLQEGGVALLPYGFECHGQKFETELTVCAPDERFSSGTAMERNALVYASGACSIVAEPRYKVGGSWHGAVDCLRRKSSLLHVFGGSEQAQSALVQLGALRVQRAGQLATEVEPRRAQRLVQEARLPYVA